MEDKRQELVVVPLALMDDILAYLGSKPYTEAAPYINAIQANSKLVPNDKPIAVIAEESAAVEEVK